MAIFIVVIIIATDSFNTILTRSNLLSRSAESNIEGVVGLEMFRHDLNQAGFGLPWEFDAATPPQYNEAEAAVAPANNYNDAPAGVPRAFLAGNNLEGAGILEKTDYLVLKGSSLASDNASQRWSYVNYSSVGSSKPKIWSSANLSDGDRVIVLRRAFTSTGYVNRLVYDTSAPSTFYTTYSKNGFATGTFTPAYPQESFYLYGISTGKPRMPFNRSDYFVKRPASIPDYCADNTGVLYKSNVLQDNGLLEEIPVLDCVADMQVVFGWDLDEDGTVEAYSDADGTTVNGGSDTVVKNTMKDSELIRNRLKLVKIYLLVQDGRKDPNFRNEKDILVGSKDEQSLTKKYDVAAINSNKWTNYRWKLYRIVVSPKNLTLK